MTSVGILHRYRHGRPACFVTLYRNEINELTAPEDKEWNGITITRSTCRWLRVQLPRGAFLILVMVFWFLATSCHFYPLISFWSLVTSWYLTTPQKLLPPNSSLRGSHICVRLVSQSPRSPPTNAHTCIFPDFAPLKKVPALTPH